MIRNRLISIIYRNSRRRISIRYNSTTNNSTSTELTYATRKQQIQQQSNDVNYPRIDTIRNKYNDDSIRLRIDQFVNKFNQYDFTQLPNKRTNEFYIIEGKISSIRKSGRAMYFIDLFQDNHKLQIMATNKLMNLTKDDFDNHHHLFKVGDYISCIGSASITNAGELTLKLIKPIEMLTPCLRQIPNRLTHKHIINNRRVLNYLVNSDSKLPIIIKSKLIQSIRQFFLNHQFLEVNTPILSGEGTGANATPFITHSKFAAPSDLTNPPPLQLRVAPELWLKKLVISGFERIFEIGTNFRNEGLDLTHNPEFTSCEFYQSFTSLSELMKLTQDLFSFIYTDLKQQGFNVDHIQPFTTEFPKYEFIPTLESKTGIPFPREITESSLIQYHNQLKLPVPGNTNPIALLDNLSEIYLESISTTIPNTPIFIYNQPEIMSPLAKSTTDSQGRPISSRFELFINGKEFVNAYEEENNPKRQFEKFELQQNAKNQFHDDEMLLPDWEYVKAMEYGLPPTGGWGCGIDRLAMLISKVDRIDLVLPFGNLRDVQKQ